MALDGSLARKPTRENPHLEMAAAVARAGVAGVPMAVVDDLELLGFELRLEPAANQRDAFGRHGCDLEHRLDLDFAEHAFEHVRISSRPRSRAFERLELGDDQAAREPGGPGIGAVDGRMRAGEHDAP